jgi:nitroimidazol reductase NimA-like FMN-containing flavoprotein (pyridoxamine 5'-phosphate oxidase superfamily)
MRRADKEIVEREAVEAILRAGEICHLGTCVDGQPYVVPLSYAYDEGCVWVHGALTGMKWDWIRANPKVCVQVETDAETVRHEEPCEFSVRYRSAVVFGTAEMVEEPEEKLRGLRIIAAAFGAPAERLTDRAAGAVAVCRIRVDRMTGKLSGYPR